VGVTTYREDGLFPRAWCVTGLLKNLFAKQSVINRMLAEPRLVQRLLSLELCDARLLEGTECACLLTSVAEQYGTASENS
jgi:hypothetical protein